ncbi:MAG: glycoside hydrolase family 99-like domain-containing protein, partial [Kiritimatiellia bacterium]
MMKAIATIKNLKGAILALCIGLTLGAGGAMAEDVARDITGWTGGQQVKDVRQLADGRVEGALAGKDPQLFSAPNLGIDLTDTKTIKLTYRNQSSGAKAKFFFITEEDPQWNEAKSKRFDVKTNDAAASVYVLDMSTVSGWAGTLTQLRFDPTDDEITETGTFAIDRIQLIGKPPAPPVPAVPRTVEVGDVVREWFGHMATYMGPRLLLSGWDLEPANLEFKYGYHSWFKVSDKDAQQSMCLSLRFVEQRAGKLTWEYKFKLPVVADGPSWALRAGKEPVIRYAVAGGKLCVEEQAGVLTPLCEVKADADCGVRTVIDVDDKSYTVQVDGKTYGKTLRFLRDQPLLDHVAFETGKAFTGELFTCPILIEKGFGLHERFITTPAGALPDDWTAMTRGGTVAAQRPGGAGHGADTLALKLDDTSATNAVAAERVFTPLTKKVMASFKVLVPGKVDGMRMVFLGPKKTPVITLATEGGNLCVLDAAGAPRVLRKDYKPTVWYDLAVRADCATGKADLYVNTVKVISDFPLKDGKGGFASVRLATPEAQAGVLWVDDIAVRPWLDYPADYVPEPKPVATGPYLVGMQSCDLWRTGTHLGWDWIKRYPERKPVTGWYNGGDPEVEDWSIKYMVENGIAFDFKCWYRGEVGFPLHSTQQTEGLDGFRWARYSDKMKFVILLTNHSDMFKNLQDWKDNVVPYLLEHIFCDPRCMRIDGKPVLGVYDPNWLNKNVGDAKAAVDYLREECVKAGYPGVCLFAQHRGDNGGEMANFKRWGFDTIYSYTWMATGGAGQQQAIQSHSNKKAIDVLPTACMGWDTRGWDGGKGYWLGKDEFASLLKWCKDTYMAAAP